jgi:hypothetical protein
MGEQNHFKPLISSKLLLEEKGKIETNIDAGTKPKD